MNDNELRFARRTSTWARLLRRFVILTTVGVGLMPPQPAHGRQAVPAESGSKCQGCTIALTEVLSIGPGLDSLGGVLPWPDIARNSRGEYVLPAGYDPGQMYVLDSTGKFIRRVGRQGKGPGEYQWISHLFISEGDTVNIIDWKLNRWTVLSPDYAYVTDFLLSGQIWDVIPVAGGQFVVSADFMNGDQPGTPLHIMDREGKVTYSFGAGNIPVAPSAGPQQTSRSLAPAGGKAFWASPSADYIVEKWSNTGEMLLRIRLEPEWFRRDDPDRRPTGLTPRIIRLHEDTTGMLLVYSITPTPDWGDYSEIIDPATGTRRITDLDQAYSTRIDLVDPTTSTIQASKVIPGYHVGSVNGGESFVTSTKDDLDVVTLHVWKVEVLKSERPNDMEGATWHHR